MRTQIPLLEATIQHSLRCAAKAVTQADHDYWVGIFKHLHADYEARGGRSVLVDKTLEPWGVKVPDDWLTAEEKAPLITK